MSRTPTTTDAFTAIADPRRRAIIELLARRGALAVGTIVAAMGVPQPMISKHLGVLREVGLVAVEKAGQHRMYRLEGKELKTMYDWIKKYENHWTQQVDRIKDRAERLQRESKSRSRPNIA